MNRLHSTQLVHPLFQLPVRLLTRETGGVKGKQPPPLNGLQYKKDPSRQGSGVFIAHGATRKNYEDLLPGVLAPSSDSGSEGEDLLIEVSFVLVANDCPSSSIPLSIKP